MTKKESHGGATLSKPPAPADHQRDLTHRVFLILTAFIAGAAVMIIELGGNRILAPWFGNSLYTWTGLIGVILVSLSCGYYLGGYLADKRPNYVILAHLLAASAVLTMLVPFLRPRLEGAIVSMDVVWGPVAATMLLFAVPGCLLAAVSPFTVRLISLLTGDKKVGISAGYVAMSSTLGSVMGTFCTGFILVPHMRLSAIFFSTAAALGVLAVAGYALFVPTRGQKTWSATVFAILFAAAWALAAVSEPVNPPSVVFEQTTFYHQIRVVEGPGPNGDIQRLLLLDNTREGSQYLSSKELPFEYQAYWQLVKVFCPGMKRAAFLGGGAFGMPERLLDAYPNAQADVVEIDPMVVQVGRKYFRVDEYPRMNALAQDARRFLRTSGQKYDLIFGDAYNGIQTIPSHLVTTEFFGLVKDRLSADGIYMMNIISPGAGENSELFASVTKTLCYVFKHVYVFMLYPDKPEVSQNIILVAASRDLKVDSIPEERLKDSPQIKKLLATYVKPNQYDISKGFLFTDDSNPVEYLVAKALRAQKM